jgi:diaphanous 1
LTQLDVYTEEKFEDEEDMRERAKKLMMNGQAAGHRRALSESELVLQDLIALAKQHGELYPIMMEILNHYSRILQRDAGLCVAKTYDIRSY